MDGLIFRGCNNFCGFCGSANSSTLEIAISVWIMKENTMATNFEPHEWVIFVQSTKIGTHENKGIHSSCKVSMNPLQVLQLIYQYKPVTESIRHYHYPEWCCSGWRYWAHWTHLGRTSEGLGPDLAERESRMPRGWDYIWWSVGLDSGWGLQCNKK